MSQQPDYETYRPPRRPVAEARLPADASPHHVAPTHPQPRSHQQPRAWAGPHASAAHARPAVSGGHVAIAWISAVLSVGYFLPWAIAATRQRSNSGAIAVVNLVVGWTMVGWVVALVMACTSERPPPVMYAVPTLPVPGWYPDGSGRHRWWDGRAWTGHVAG